MKLLFMRLIKNSNPDDYSYNRRINEADQAQREKINLRRELQMKSRLYTRSCREIEELRRICCEETERARQARIDELCMHHGGILRV